MCIYKIVLKAMFIHIKLFLSTNYILQDMKCDYIYLACTKCDMCIRGHVQYCCDTKGSYDLSQKELKLCMSLSLKASATCNVCNTWSFQSMLKLSTYFENTFIDC